MIIILWTSTLGQDIDRQLQVDAACGIVDDEHQYLNVISRQMCIEQDLQGTRDIYLCVYKYIQSISLQIFMHIHEKPSNA